MCKLFIYNGFKSRKKGEKSLSTKRAEIGVKKRQRLNTCGLDSCENVDRGEKRGVLTRANYRWIKSVSSFEIQVPNLGIKSEAFQGMNLHKKEESRKFLLQFKATRDRTGFMNERK